MTQVGRTLTIFGLVPLMPTAGCAAPNDSTTPAVAHASVASDQLDKPTVVAANVNSRQELVARVLGDNEDVWDATLRNLGHSYYPKPVVVFFHERVASACGMIVAAAGPHYCPIDYKVYVDTTFLGEETGQLGASSDFVQAYLVAHEIGRHVQNILGTMPKSSATTSAVTEPQSRRKQIPELQADCYVGIWIRSLQQRDLLEPGDLETALPAALVVGDAHTRGEAAERLRWFRQGLTIGDPMICVAFRDLATAK